MTYSIENSKKFKWSSITGSLNPYRVSHLEKYILGSKLLDAGCGGGAYVEFLANQGLQVTGIDKYEQFLQLAKTEGRLGNYVKSDVTDIPFTDNEFDFTYCFDVLEHVEDKVAIKELVRVTRKRLVITVPKEDEIFHNFNLTFLHYQDKTHLRNYTEESLRNLILQTDQLDFRIFPELCIPSRALIQEILELNVIDSGIKNLHKRFLKQAAKKILDRINHKKVYTSLVAVIEIHNNPP